MRRREFITLVGGVAASWPLAARAQAAKMPIIGLMGSGTSAAQSQWTSAFLDRLRELGWTEGRNIPIEYRWAEGRSERFAEIADELVRLKVDVIVTHNTPGPLAAKKATSVIPIVFATAGDPVGTGIVASLARPGGNVTGLSSQAPDTAERRLELLRGVVPGLHRLSAGPPQTGHMAEPNRISGRVAAPLRTATRSRGNVMANFTPVYAAIGGALIGLSAVLLMLFTGRIAGVSGIFDGLVNPQTSDRAWRA